MIGKQILQLEHEESYFQPSKTASISQMATKWRELFSFFSKSVTRFDIWKKFFDEIFKKLIYSKITIFITLNPQYPPKFNDRLHVYKKFFVLFNEYNHLVVFPSKVTRYAIFTNLTFTRSLATRKCSRYKLRLWISNSKLLKLIIPKKKKLDESILEILWLYVYTNVWTDFQIKSRSRHLE